MAKPQPSRKPEPGTLADLFRPSLFLFFGFLFLLTIPYHPDGGYNVNTRLNLVFALVDSGTVKIDNYHDVAPYSTGDKALFEGHYYSDKIFGVSLLAIPFYAAAKFLAGGDISYHLAYFASKFGAVALPGAIAWTLFFLLLARTGTPPKRATILSALTFAGTMILGYGTIFMPYMPGIAAMLGALYLTYYPPGRRLTLMNCLVIGFLLGFALICETTMGLAVFGIGVIWLSRLLDQAGILGQRAFAEMAGDRSSVKQIIPLALIFWVGVLIPTGSFAGYSYAIFDEVTMPYKYEANQLFAEGMSKGFFGITAPDPAVLWMITFHPYRGLFFWSPILIAAAAGCVFGLNSYGKRFHIGLLGLWCLLAYLFINSGYYMWWGGWCMGPRILIPAIPFLALGLGELARYDKLSWFGGPTKLANFFWYGTIVLGVVSVALSLPLSLFDPQIPQGNQTNTLLEIDFNSDIAVPQFIYLQAFYNGAASLWPWRRLTGIVERPELVSNWLSIAVYLLIGGGLIAAAWWFAPERMKGADRADFPLKTIDGAAATI